MKTKVADVKSKQNKVGECEYKVYDSVDEAIEDLGEASALNMLNAQVRTNAMNQARALATGKPGKKALYNQAIAEIDIEEFKKVAGDAGALKILIEQKVLALEAKRQAEAPSVELDDLDEDDE